MAQETADTDATWAAVIAALTVHLEATGWLDPQAMLADFWIIAQCAPLDGRTMTKYYHGGPDLPAHRAVGLVEISRQMLAYVPSHSGDDD